MAICQLRTPISVSITFLLMELAKERAEEVGEWMKVVVDVDVRLIHDCSRRIISCHQRKVTIWQRRREESEVAPRFLTPPAS